MQKNNHKNKSNKWADTMLKGKQLIDYTVNQIGGDKLIALRTLVDEVIGHFDDDTNELMDLVNPYDLYQFLEKRIVNQTYYEEQIRKFLEKRGILLPIMWGWKHDQEGYGIIYENDGFKDKHECYCNMHKFAIEAVKSGIDLHEEIRVRAKYPDSIIIESDESKHIFTVYEM